jgi:hypothetical protein
MSKIQIVVEKYGVAWPKGTPEAMIELYGFKEGHLRPGFLTRYQHALNAAALIWPQFPVKVKLPNDWYYKQRGLGGLVIENNFFLEVMEGLCKSKKVGLTGCASSGKSYGAAMYALMMFYSDPLNTMIMLSTTSGDALKHRIWGEIKKLHNEATFKMGTILDYLKALIFDPSLAIKDEKDASLRDMRNGLIGIAIPNDSQGQGALMTIAGRKNKNVIWIIDELTFMPANIMDPCINLMANPFFQVIGLGNAARQTDPHGNFCEPKTGWPDNFTEKSWETKTGGLCIHLDGTRSPNLFPGHEKIDQVEMLPFPTLINHLSLRDMAVECGQGDLDQGRKSAKYWMMARGIWMSSAMDATVLSSSIVKQAAADQDCRWGYGQRMKLAACDPSFTVTGDDFVVLIGEMGPEEGTGHIVLKFQPNHILITPEMGTGGELYDQLAAKVVQILLANGIEPRGFGMDVSHDGGIMAQAIMKLYGSNDIHLLSSLGLATDRRISDQDNAPAKDRYDRQVTEYWFSLRVAVQLGRIRGFNVNSEYADHLFQRRYDFRPGGKVAIETKKDMKERLKKSPGAGDAATYLLEVARRNGLPMEKIQAQAAPKPKLILDPFSLKPTQEKAHMAYAKKPDRSWGSLRRFAVRR